MLTLFEEGGFPIWFLLAFGASTLIGGATFAARPEPWRLRVTSALGLATLFTTLTAISADLAMVGHHLPEYLRQHPALSLSAALLQGVAESMSPLILGFTMLSLASLIVAFGLYRSHSRLAAGFDDRDPM